MIEARLQIGFRFVYVLANIYLKAFKEIWNLDLLAANSFGQATTQNFEKPLFHWVHESGPLQITTTSML